MWIIVVALLLKSGPAFYALPKQYVGIAECQEATEKLKTGWQSTVQVGYKCRRVWRI